MAALKEYPKNLKSDSLSLFLIIMVVKKMKK